MDERTQFIVNHCRGKRVLHVGCADWPYTERRIAEGELLHAELLKVSSEVVGIDVSVEGLDLLRRTFPGERFLLSSETGGLQYAPEVILAGEVIEHVDDPGGLVRFFTEISVSDSKLLLTTPNAYSLKGAVRAAVGKEYCHPDHVVHFSASTLVQLLERYGWHPEKVEFYFSRPTTILGRMASVWFVALRLLLSSRIGDGIMVIAHRNHHSQ